MMPHTVFTEVARCFVHHERSLWFLSAAHPKFAKPEILLTRAGKETLLPTWVPDWSREPNITALGMGRDFSEPYNAGGHPAIASADESCLDATGTLLDTISRIGLEYGKTRPG